MPSLFSTWILLASLLPPVTAFAGEILFRFENENGQPVQLRKAELLLVAWGVAERRDLTHTDNTLLLAMSEKWVRDGWPIHFDHMMRAFLLFRAEGYAPIRSMPIAWPGVGEQPEASGAITLPNGATTLWQKGSRTEVTVVFRKPKQRLLRIVDPTGIPIPDVRVQAALFWSASNHTGYLSGADPLATASTDENGLVTIPDGDIEYVFEIIKPYHVLIEPSGFIPPRLICFLRAPVTTIVLRRLEQRQITFEITLNGKPQQGVHLCGRLANCDGACAGVLATSDRNGIIRLSFYPERYSRLFIPQDIEDRKPLLWEIAPPDLVLDGVNQITLTEMPEHVK